MRRTKLGASSSIPLLTALSFALGGCAAPVVVGSAALVVNDRVVDNAITTTVPYTVDYVWSVAKSSVSHMTGDLLDIDPDLRTITTYIDGAEVVVQVETFDVGETRILVAAKRYLVFSDAIAGNVRDGIVRDLG